MNSKDNPELADKIKQLFINVHNAHIVLYGEGQRAYMLKLRGEQLKLLKGYDNKGDIK